MRAMPPRAPYFEPPAGWCFDPVTNRLLPIPILTSPPPQEPWRLLPKPPRDERVYRPFRHVLKPGFCASRWAYVDMKGRLQPLPLPLTPDGKAVDKERREEMKKEFKAKWGTAVTFRW